MVALGNMPNFDARNRRETETELVPGLRHGDGDLSARHRDCGCQASRFWCERLRIPLFVRTIEVRCLTNWIAIQSRPQYAHPFCPSDQTRWSTFKNVLAVIRTVPGTSRGLTSRTSCGLNNAFVGGVCFFYLALILNPLPTFLNSFSCFNFSLFCSFFFKIYVLLDTISRTENISYLFFAFFLFEL